MEDEHQRTIDYLRISLTDRCNLRCVYCMPEEGVCSIPHERILSLEEIEAVVKQAAKLGVKHIRLTGGEPLVRKGVVGLVHAISCTPGIESVALTTNGTLLPQFAHSLKEAGLSRINISLDTLDEEKYRAITRRGEFSAALEGIKTALDVGFDPVKINAVAVRSFQQDYFAFAQKTIDAPLHVRFIEFMPIGGKDTSWGTEEVVSAQEIMDRINERALLAGMQALEPAGDHAPTGWGPARSYRLPGAQGTVGFISSLSNHFCASCNRIRLTADGKLKPCLFSSEEVDVRSALRHGTEDDVRKALAHVIQSKPEGHKHHVGTARTMSQVGG